MEFTFHCSCGQPLTVDEKLRGKKAFCMKCRKSADIPAAELAPVGKEASLPPLGGQAGAPKPAASAPAPGPAALGAASADGEGEDLYGGEIFEPPHLERTTQPNLEGEFWKLTCFCGKRILSPLRTPVPLGRCPKCGRRLRLPGFRPERSKSGRGEGALPGDLIRRGKTLVLKDGDQGGLVEASGKEAVGSEEKGKSAGPASSSDLPPLMPLDEGGTNEDEIGTIVMEPLTVEELDRDRKINREAALHTADLLRAHNVREKEDGQSSIGLVRAWPLAGRAQRLLAGFIDCTAYTVVLGLMLVLSALQVLPKAVANPVVLLITLLTAALLNDILLQAFGGSLGKRVVVLVLRARGGSSPTFGLLVLRGILKWALVPGWLLGITDPAERALHDILCKTVVLKGRSRGAAASGN